VVLGTEVALSGTRTTTIESGAAADKATERDGSFSSNTTFSNGWYYAAVLSNNISN